jgi:hypothetical protein
VLAALQQPQSCRAAGSLFFFVSTWKHHERLSSRVELYLAISLSLYLLSLSRRCSVFLPTKPLTLPVYVWHATGGEFCRKGKYFGFFFTRSPPCGLQSPAQKTSWFVAQNREAQFPKKSSQHDSGSNLFGYCAREGNHPSSSQACVGPPNLQTRTLTSMLVYISEPTDSAAGRVVITRKSRPANNRNVSRLISNLSRLKKKVYPVLVYPVIFPI